jgi:hypothetical protein
VAGRLGPLQLDGHHVGQSTWRTIRDFVRYQTEVFRLSAYSA